MNQVGARQPALSRQDLQRRDGTLGEIDTVRERLARVNRILSRHQLLSWRSVLWHIEQLRQQTAMQAALHPSVLTQAMQRTVDSLDDALAQVDALHTEARAETEGARRHLEDVIPSARIDQYLADRLRRLTNAGLSDAQIDAVMNGDAALEAAS